MTRLIVISLPGMAEAEIITRSPASIVTCLCSENAMRCSADIGSPWLPVQTITVLLRGRLPICDMSIMTPSGMST